MRQRRNVQQSEAKHTHGEWKSELAHGRDTSVHNKALKPLLQTESSVYLRLVDVVNTSCKQQKLSVSRLQTDTSYVRRLIHFFFFISLLQSSETIYFFCLRFNLYIKSLLFFIFKLQFFLHIQNHFWCEWSFHLNFMSSHLIPLNELCVIICCGQIHAFNWTQIRLNYDDESVWQVLAARNKPNEYFTNEVPNNIDTRLVQPLCDRTERNSNVCRLLCVCVLFFSNII